MVDVVVKFIRFSLSAAAHFYIRPVNERKENRMSVTWLGQIEK